MDSVALRACPALMARGYSTGVINIFRDPSSAGSDSPDAAEATAMSATSIVAKPHEGPRSASVMATSRAARATSAAHSTRTARFRRVRRDRRSASPPPTIPATSSSAVRQPATTPATATFPVASMTVSETARLVLDVIVRKVVAPNHFR